MKPNVRCENLNANMLMVLHFIFSQLEHKLLVFYFQGKYLVILANDAKRN